MRSVRWAQIRPSSCTPTPGPPGCGFQPQPMRLCNTDADCTNGFRLPGKTKAPCATGPDIVCIPRCTASSSAAGERCGTDGRCEIFPCADGTATTGLRRRGLSITRRHRSDQHHEDRQVRRDRARMRFDGRGPSTGFVQHSDPIVISNYVPAARTGIDAARHEPWVAILRRCRPDRR